MATKKEDQCDICGKNKNLVTTYNKKTCSTCGFILRAVKNTPALVVHEIFEMWGSEYFPKPAPAGEEINEEYKRRANAAEKVIADLRAMLEVPEEKSLLETLSHLKTHDLLASQELFSALENNDRLIGERNAMQERISAISDELNELREITVAAARIAGVEFSFSPGAFETPTLLRKVVNRYEEMGTPLESCLSEKTGRDAALLDLALGVLAGKINGIDASLISSLR